jgi:hypothetical protein
MKLVKNYPPVKRLENCSNKGSNIVQKENNYKNAKIGSGPFKKFSSRTTKKCSNVHDSCHT